MKSIFLALFSIGILASPSLARETPPAAKDLLAKAQTEAAATKKTVFVGFHASWCGWCKKMESVLNRPEIKPIWNKYFVSVWLVVLESDVKKNLENPGGMEALKANGGDKGGIPFFYFVDAKGKTIVTSNRPASGADKGGNVGCPYEPAEVAWFMTMLEKASPNMAGEDRSAIKGAFESLKKADGKAG